MVVGYSQGVFDDFHGLSVFITISLYIKEIEWLTSLPNCVSVVAPIIQTCISCPFLPTSVYIWIIASLFDPVGVSGEKLGMLKFWYES